jgi:hypothetical protein
MLRRYNHLRHAGCGSSAFAGSSCPVDLYLRSTRSTSGAANLRS